MNDVIVEFPEKCLLLNRLNKDTFRMRPLKPNEPHPYPYQRTTLPIKTTTGPWLRETVKCHVTDAFLFKGPYVRWIDGIPPKEILDNARISVHLETWRIIDEMPLGKVVEGEPYPIDFKKVHFDIFFAMPYAPVQDEAKEAIGLFLPNGSLVEVKIEGLDQEIRFEIGLVIAEYRSSSRE